MVAARQRAHSPRGMCSGLPACAGLRGSLQEGDTAKHWCAAGQGLSSGAARTCVRGSDHCGLQLCNFSFFGGGELMAFTGKHPVASQRNPCMTRKGPASVKPQGPSGQPQACRVLARSCTWSSAQKLVINLWAQVHAAWCQGAHSRSVPCCMDLRLQMDQQRGH